MLPGVMLLFMTPRPLNEALQMPLPRIPCGAEDVLERQPHPCIYFCYDDIMDSSKMVWMTSDDLEIVDRAGPGAKEFQ